jgi:hypothetical protein
MDRIAEILNTKKGDDNHEGNVDGTRIYQA